MLLPHRVREKGVLEQRFGDYLTRERFGYRIMEGKAAAQNPQDVCTFSAAEALAVQKRFLAADLAFINARHQVPMLYHFACRVDKEKERAFLLEYLDIFAEEKDLHYIVMLEILGMEGIHTLVVPALLTRELYQGYTLEFTDTSHTILRKQR
ncbi:hypothetical protein GCM10010912_36910 [Paenibacillus albidus]|uniref:Uncharacterized protein n=1 Tax=Paenibacillus albidus TaxID=2041023 RepID=A0A917FJY9_9BACL|nr:hypothetical protein [Paenibacillus albidus]GGF88265.1 hypothetical protein GCM10010912_36910 [Paenibacillus albidus]